jgi:DNA-binding beta-propeller fold protein YncE
VKICTLMLMIFSAAMLQASDLIYIANQSDNSVKLYNGTTGAFMETVVPPNSGDLNQANGIAIGPDGSIYVSGQASNNIAKFSSSGAFEGDFVSGTGGLNSPQAIHFGPDGNLYAVSSANDEILRYSGTTGAFLGVFAHLGTPVHDGPIDFAFSSNGQVWVTTFDSGRIVRLSASGAFLGSLPLPASADPLAFVGAAFGPNGNFYVTGLDTQYIRRVGLSIQPEWIALGHPDRERNGWTRHARRFALRQYGRAGRAGCRKPECVAV